MRMVVAALVGEAGSGTAALGTRVASILNWPFASFGAYVRAESARHQLTGARSELQDTGLGLVQDTEGFCRAVIAQSYWRPGQSLVVDGLRHPAVLKTLRRMFKPTEVIGIYVTADDRTRERKLLERGEFHAGGLSVVDQHPVERGVRALRRSAQAVFDGTLPQANLIDQLLEFLFQAAEIPTNHSWITSENLLYLPAALRQQLGLQEGDRMELRAFENLLAAVKIVDVDRMRSDLPVMAATGRVLELRDPGKLIDWSVASGEPPQLQRIDAATQARLDELMSKNTEGALDAAERRELDKLGRLVEKLSLENASLLASHGSVAGGTTKKQVRALRPTRSRAPLRLKPPVKTVVS